MKTPETVFGNTLNEKVREELFGKPAEESPARTEKSEATGPYLERMLEDIRGLPPSKQTTRVKSFLGTVAHLEPPECDRCLTLASKKLDISKLALKNQLEAMTKAEEKTQNAKTKTTNLDGLKDSRRLHPAIDFVGESLTLGFRVPNEDGKADERLLLLVSSPGGVSVFVAQDRVEVGEKTYRVNFKKMDASILGDVWGIDRLKRFVESPSAPTDLFQQLVKAFSTFLDLPESAYGLMVAWVVGTYFAHGFSAYVFLHFVGPKETGKTKALEALFYVCLNAWKGRDITSAALGDTTESLRGTVLLDQAEDLPPALVGLIGDSYKKAGGRRRVVEITKTGRKVLEFSTYGPKAFASTKDLDPDLQDRCVRIPMVRTDKNLPDLEGWEPIWGELRDRRHPYYRIVEATRSRASGIAG
jgi:hypothetical protein